MQQARLAERSLRQAALVAGVLDRPEVAARYWERAVAVNPWTATGHAHLAKVLGDRRQWQRAAAECDAVLQLDPEAVDTRMYLVLCHLRLGHGDQARAEFDRVLALNPPNAEVLRRWYASERER